VDLIHRYPSAFYGMAAGCGAKPYPYKPYTPSFKVHRNFIVPNTCFAQKEVSGYRALVSAWDYLLPQTLF